MGREFVASEHEALNFEQFASSVVPKNVYSQFGEDGVIEAIFGKIGTTNKYCVEFGINNGIFFSNTRRLVTQEGWKGLWIEGDEKLAGMARENVKANNFAVTVLNRMVGVEGENSLDSILASQNAPVEFDLLSIDIDSYEFYIWNSLLKFRPRVVVCEFNPLADDNFIPDLGGPGQASQLMIHNVAVSRGYQPVCKTQVNLICLRNDLCHLLSGDAPLAQQLLRVAAVASTPRLGFLTHSDCILQALAPLQIPLLRGEGAYWSQTLSRAIQRALETGADYILTLDYDTVFNQADVARLVTLLHDNPDYDALVSVQQQREGGELLATSDGEVNLNQPIIPIIRGQFALTLFRRSVFEKLSLPWFKETPGPDGHWQEGRIDADIGFWHNCVESGVKVGLAMDVVVGHLELMITWPNLDRRPHYQHINAWRDGGMAAPEQAFNRERLVERVMAETAPPKALAATLNMGD